MASIALFENEAHQNILLEDFGEGEAVQANTHLIVHDGAGMLLDPGGHKVFNKTMSELNALLKGGELRYIFASHQDPDIVAALNGWLMTTDATAYASTLWTRFIPHFGLDSLVIDRLKAIPDEGALLSLADGAELVILPAHFLHSCGNFHLYDPISKILYTGDLGTSLGTEYREVPDFESHLPRIVPFHERYMGSGKALKAWAKMARSLDIETIAPQHGAYYRGKAMVSQFLDWCETLDCGIDLLADCYKVPRSALAA
ncbi:MAG: MBL fold metallo-hydrolase [Nitrospiria bacterium]